MPLVASSGGRLVAELEARGGEWIRMPVDTKSPLTLFANIGRLQRLIRVRNIKLLHARSRAPAWSALLATRREGVPFVTTYHGAYSTKSALKRFYNSAMLRGNAVIANSEWTAEQIRTRYAVKPARIVTIHRGIDLDRFDPERVSSERVQALRHAWNVLPDDTVVLLPGRLSRRKGQLVAIDAVAEIAAEGTLDKLRLVLAGEGHDAYAAEVEQAIHRRGLDHAVTIAGHIDDMPAAYLAADIVIFASSEPEGFGRIAAEAGAMGRPVIVADHGGAPEIVLPRRSGYLVAPGDARALAIALKETMAAGAAGRSEMGAEGRAHVSRNFTLDHMAYETLTLYRELLTAEPSTSSG